MMDRESDDEPLQDQVNQIQDAAAQDETEAVDQDAIPRRYTSPDRTFFCSELVIKIMKIVGIIKPNPRSSKNFLPAHLTQAQQGFEMIDEATIGPEQLIITQHMTDEQ